MFFDKKIRFNQGHAQFKCSLRCAPIFFDYLKSIHSHAVAKCIVIEEFFQRITEFVGVVNLYSRFAFDDVMADFQEIKDVLSEEYGCCNGAWFE